MIVWKRLVPLVLIFSSLVSSRSLEKRQLKFGNCNTKIRTGKGLFEVEEEPLRTAVKPLNDGVTFLQNLCQALPKACGQVKESDVENCNNQAKKLFNGNLGTGLAQKCNNLGGGNNKRGGDKNKQGGGNGRNPKGGQNKQQGDKNKKQGGNNKQQDGQKKNN